MAQMKDTRTAKASPDCPTLLHYLARVLMKSDAELVNFMDDLPHLEAAARGLIVGFPRKNITHSTRNFSIDSVSFIVCDYPVRWPGPNAHRDQVCSCDEETTPRRPFPAGDGGWYQSYFDDCETNILFSHLYCK